VWVESRGRPTSWHPEHINERYGLFTMIVLGQCVAAATLAMRSAITDQGVFAATAAVGDELEVAANTLTHGSHVPAPSAAFLVGLPVALYILVVGGLHVRMSAEGAITSGAPVVTAAAVVLCAASAALIPLALTIAAMGACVAAQIGCTLIAAHPRAISPHATLRLPQDSGVTQ
jgi:hypothetical protein